MDIRFISNNQYKIDEAASILNASDVNVIPVNMKI